MIRWFGLLAFVFAVVLVSCGRQVTGLSTSSADGGVGNGLPSGEMLLRFRVAGQLDFTNYRYVMVFNTSGTGTEPYANAYVTGFTNYSYAWVVGGQGGAVSEPQLFQYILNPGTNSGLTSRQVAYPTQLVQFTANDNGNGNEFELIFNRSIFDQPNPTATQGATPTPEPTTAATWFMNYITTNTALTPLDAEGVQGVNDVSYVLQFNVETSFDLTQQLTVPAGAVQLPADEQAAQITGGEVVNTP